jgi:RimJ/RimL family protein N-acetyltransferase
MAASALDGIDLNSSSTILVHGWTCGPLLIEFAHKFVALLSARPSTARQIAERHELAVGPVALCLRSAAILGYAEYDPKTNKFSVVDSDALVILNDVLGQSSRTACALKRVYSECVAPFKLPSKELMWCLRVWSDHRSSWANGKCGMLSSLLDGIILVPLLASIAYFACWDGDGLRCREMNLDKLDFSEVDPSSRIALDDILSRVGLATINSVGRVSETRESSSILERCCSFLFPASYSKLLCSFDDALRITGGHCTGSGQDVFEAMDLHVIGKGMQQQIFFDDMIGHIRMLFDADDFEKQPQFIVDASCGAGHSLIDIYEYVRRHTSRGKVLERYPLIMIAVEESEDSRLKRVASLVKAQVPHKILLSDARTLVDIVTALKSHNVEPRRGLFFRSLGGHERPILKQDRRVLAPNCAHFATAQMRGFVQLDKSGQILAESDVFGTFLDYFERVGEALEGTFGMCIQEELMQDVLTTRGSIKDSTSFHIDIVRSLSRQYMISPVAYSLGAAMCGLLPDDVRSVSIHRSHGDDCPIIGQNLVRRNFKIRLAELSDMPALERLEKLGWAEELRAEAAVLKRRLETSPTTNLVYTVDGDVVGVLYMQRIPDIETISQESFMGVSDAHDPDGKIIQLIAIIADPAFRGDGIGNELRSFALHLARLDPTVQTVVAVTRCRDYKKFNGTMEEYVEQHVAGSLIDPILSFHTDYGAKVVSLPLWRPEDVDNKGIGVLIQYDLTTVLKGDGGATEAANEVGVDADDACVGDIKSTLGTVKQIMHELGYPVDDDDLGRGFLDFGMDSLELVSLSKQLANRLKLSPLPSTFLFDHPSVLEVSKQLDESLQRASMVLKQVVGTSTRSTADCKSNHLQTHRDVSFGEKDWSNITSSELVDMQRECLSTCKQPSFQNRFVEAAKQSYPDMLKYISEVDRILIEVQGPIFGKRNLIPNLQIDSVQIARKKIFAVVGKYWADVPEVSRLGQELARVTKQDQWWMP